MFHVTPVTVFSRHSVRRSFACLALSALLLGSLALTPVLRAEGSPLISNPGFILDDNFDGWPDGWIKGKGLSWHPMKAPELSYMRVTVEEPGKSPVFYREIPLKAGTRSIDYVIQARADDVVGGDESWHDARLQLEFRTADKSKIRPVPKPLVVSRAGSVDWKVFSGTLDVPQGAAYLVIVGALFHCQSGTLDIGMVDMKAQ